MEALRLDTKMDAQELQSGRAAFPSPGAEKAPATRKAYWKDFELFGLWCQEQGLAVLPASAESVAAYLAFEADRCASAS